MVAGGQSTNQFAIAVHRYAVYKYTHLGDLAVKQLRNEVLPCQSLLYAVASLGGEIIEGGIHNDRIIAPADDSPAIAVKIDHVHKITVILSLTDLGRQGMEIISLLRANEG